MNKTILKKAKSEDEASRIVDFLLEYGYHGEVEKNEDFMADKYPFQVIGSEKLLGFIERHESLRNVVTNSQTKKATWNKPKKEWQNVNLAET